VAPCAMHSLCVGGQFVLCDLQGGFYRDGIVLTDPVVMSRNQRYGATDLGPDGLTAFFNHHQCNKFCRAHWTRPKMRGVNIVPKSGTSMRNSKGQMIVPTRPSRAPISRPAVPKFNAIQGELVSTFRLALSLEQ
jgi:Alpha-kinase family